MRIWVYENKISANGEELKGKGARFEIQRVGRLSPFGPLSNFGVNSLQRGDRSAESLVRRTKLRLSVIP
jgi:hypothetical protein